MKLAYRVASLKAALCSGAAIGLLASIPAYADSQILAGNYITIGLNEKGTLGYDGRVSPGILYDGTGTGTFNTAYDYLTPGSPFEGFVIAGTGAGSTFSIGNNNAYTATITGGTLTNYSGVEYNGTTYDLRAVWTATVADLFTITNDYYFNVTDQKVNITTSITALSDLTGLSFSRELDPDAVAATGDSSVTNNYRGTDTVAETDLVYAEALVSKYVIGLYTDTSYDHNAAVTGWTRDTASYLAGTNVGNGDNTIGLGFSLGDLLTGSSLSFDYSYIFGTDIAAAVGGAGNITGNSSISDLLSGSVLPVLDGGSLIVDASGSYSSDIGITANNGTIDTAGNDAALTGTISGDGSLTKTGAGTLVLTGANTYTGGTTIADGTLVGTTTSIQGAIVNNAALVIDQDSDGTLAGDISGTGSFTKDGTGTVVLTGTNSYTGGTTILDGTLVGNTNSLQGDVANNANLVFDQGTDGTYTGAVSGSGSLTKTGAGTLVLTGANAYTGGTTIADGTLVGTTTSIQGDIANNAALILDQNSNGTFAGDISGTGSFTKDGTGTVVLTGTNSYTGGTTILGGTLVGDTGNLQGDVANSGALVFDQSTDGTYTGAVSGSGSLTKTGAGTLVLTGANAYTGGTVIDGGTLVGDTGSIQGDIANNAALVIDQNSDGTLASDISGTGSFTKTGTGTLVLSGTNSYAGGTAILDGTLVGNTNSLQGDIANNANLVFDQAAAGAHTGDISGTGSLTKTGAGTLVLTGVNTYTGGTAIDQGTLVGNTGSLQGDVVNNAAMILDQNGSGTFAGDISGTGSFTKDGTGAVVLTGTNSYTGGTTILGGSLIGDTDSLQGDVVNSGALVFDQSTNGTYTGAVSGSGSLTKTGAGTLVLTGANAYTGGTVIDGGTLVGDTGSIQGDIANNANLVFYQVAAGAHAGDISGTGSLTKTGEGTLALTGTNTYTGGTTIAQGTLLGNTGSLQGDVVNNAALILDQNGNGTFAGDISGTGSFTKDGTGAVVLTGTNSYTGGTTILGGSLIGNSDSLRGDVANSGTVVFDQTTDGTYTGAVSGSGMLAKTGTGTLVLTGTNSYTGGTLVTGGSLVGDTTSLQGPILNTANVEFNQTSAGVFGDSISGTGTVTKTGAGSLNFTGTSDYTGATSIDEGRLAVNGSIANSIVTVNNGGTVGGNGTVGGLIVRTGATAAPGNSIGHLHVASDLTFEVGSTYAVEVNAAGAADRISTTGVATIEGGTVQVLAEAGDYKPQGSYIILTADGGVAGTFDDVTSNFAFLVPTLSYSANGVLLTLTRNDVTFAQAGTTANQIAVGTAIDGTFPIGTPIYDALVGSSTSEIGSGLDALSGEIHASTLSVAADDAAILRRTLLDRARSAAPSSITGGKIALWADVGGNWNDKDGNRNAAKVSSSGYRFVGGVEFSPSDSLKLGVAGGTAHQDVTVARRASTADLDEVYGAIYAAAGFGPLTLRAGASYADLDTKTARTIDYRSLEESLKANGGGSVKQVFGEAGYVLPLGVGSIEPFAGFNALWLTGDRFHETGGTAALKGSQRTQGYGWTSAGLRLTLGTATAPVAVRTKIAWEHATSDVDVGSRVAFQAGGSSFIVEGAPLSRDSVNLDAAIEWRATSAFSLGAGYTGSIGSRGEDHGVRASATVRF